MTRTSYHLDHLVGHQPVRELGIIGYLWLASILPSPSYCFAPYCPSSLSPPSTVPFSLLILLLSTFSSTFFYIFPCPSPSSCLCYWLPIRLSSPLYSVDSLVSVIYSSSILPLTSLSASFPLLHIPLIISLSLLSLYPFLRLAG